MTTALATTERSVGRAMIVADALQEQSEQRKLLSKYIGEHMVEGEDYGVIPGTVKKTLLKPGAEKLTGLFRCVPDFIEEKCIEDWSTGLFYYRYKCEITNEAGAIVAVGVGSCSTYESRYRWRNADRACPACGKATIKRSKNPPRDDPQGQPGWYCFGKIGGCGENFAADDQAITGQQTGRIENPDLADCANTVLKIAKKRAHVDASLALSRCSDIFTQDVEDMPGPQQQKPAGPSLDDCRRWLTDAADLIALQSAWAQVPKALQPELAKLKDERKAALTPKPQPASPPPSAVPQPDPDAAAEAAAERAAIQAADAPDPANPDAGPFAGKPPTAEMCAVDLGLFQALAERKGRNWSALTSDMNGQFRTMYHGRTDWNDVKPEHRKWAAEQLLARPDAKKGA